MTPDETARVLGVAAMYDKRTVGRADVMAWHSVIGHLDARDAAAAVRTYYGQHARPIMPADVKQLVTSAKGIRAVCPTHGQPLLRCTRCEDEATPPPANLRELVRQHRPAHDDAQEAQP